MQNLSGADAAINCWNDKYYWDFWRPWNAIPRAAEDGNPRPSRPDLDAADLGAVPRAPVRATSATTVRTSASCGCSSATAPTGASQITSRSTFLLPTDPDAQLHSFSQALAEIVEARIWAGLHFRTADVQGEAARSERRRLHGSELLPAGRPARLTDPGMLRRSRR